MHRLRRLFCWAVEKMVAMQQWLCLSITNDGFSRKKDEKYGRDGRWSVGAHYNNYIEVDLNASLYDRSYFVEAISHSKYPQTTFEKCHAGDETRTRDQKRVSH